MAEGIPSWILGLTNTLNTHHVRGCQRGHAAAATEGTASARALEGRVLLSDLVGLLL